MASVVGDLTRIEEQLAALWREQAASEGSITRACKMNLVVVVDGRREAAEEANRLIAVVSATEPGRVIVVTTADDSAPAMHACVSAHCHRGANGSGVCSEQITLEVREDALDRVPSTVLQLLVEEVPTCTLWHRPALTPRSLLDALCGISDRLIVDSAVSLITLEELHELASRPRPRLDDLTWARLEPWREAVASLFERPGMRGHIDRIARVKVETGGSVAGSYFVGWLAARLGWRHRGAGRWQRADGQPVEIEIVASEGGEKGRPICVELEVAGERCRHVMRVEQQHDKPDVVHLCVEGGEAIPAKQCLKMPPWDDASTLAGMLQREQDDSVFRAALWQAVRHGRR